MSASSKINDSPGHFMVLQAMARGFDTVEKITTVIRKSQDEVKDIINDLVNQRLANMREKGHFFGSKERKFTITETGRSRELNIRNLDKVKKNCDKCMIVETDGSYRAIWIPIGRGSHSCW